jgi:phosphatidate cytidylyltransferase
LNNLLQRILFAVPAAALFIWITWLGGWFFQGMMVIIGFFIIQEMIKILEQCGQPTDALFPYTLGLWIMLSPTLPFAFEIGVGILVLFLSVQTFNQAEVVFSKLTSSLFAGIYAPLGLLCFMLINQMGEGTDGFVLSMMLIFMVWGSDVFAYFGGKTFGKRALAPKISPKKTWEGFFFGYVGSLVGASIVYFLFPLDMPITFTLVVPITILVATFGPIGDLLESKLKRRANIKDSSTILPGHGGFFDRFDALLLAAPVVFISLQIFQEIGVF